MAQGLRSGGKKPDSAGWAVLPGASRAAASQAVATHTHYTFGPAASPGGTDNRTFAMAVQAESAQEARALSGSYNPVTHQIARHSPDCQSSWL